MAHRIDISRIGPDVADRLDAAGFSLRQASDATGIPLSTLRRRLMGSSPFNTDELGAVAELLGVTVAILVATADIGAESTDPCRGTAA